LQSFSHSFVSFGYMNLKIAAAGKPRTGGGDGGTDEV
jgi:hypothetical protein